MSNDHRSLSTSGPRAPRSWRKRATFGTLAMAMLPSVLAVSPAHAEKRTESRGCRQLTQEKVADAEDLIDRIEERLDDEPTGWQIAVGKDCRLAASRAGGWASIEDAEPMTVLHRSAIGSVAKLVTAILIMGTLEESGADPAGLDPDTSIEPYVKMNWESMADEPVAKLSWSSLMNQTSGIVSGPGSGTSSALSFEDITKNYLDTADDKGVYKYDNANAILLRVLFRSLYWGQGLSGDYEEMEHWTSTLYQWAVQAEVFDPLGIQSSCGASADDPYPVARLYNANNPGAPGTFPDKSASLEYCAAGGWYLSSIDLLRIGIYLRHTDKLVSEASLDRMDTDLLGWENPTTGWDAAISGNVKLRFKGGSNVGQACLLDFGDGTEVAILTNSNHRGAVQICTDVAIAFNEQGV